MHRKQIVYAGKKLGEAQKALVMVHGRGASASDILSLAGVLHANDFSLVAPQATNNTWYPLSFLSPVSANEPWLSSSLQLLNDVVNDMVMAGIAKKDIYFLGFSQGACLTLEFVTRNAHRYGGIIAFTGGLIGETIDISNYVGNFTDMPVFIGSSNPDPHVPVSRVLDTEKVMKGMGADMQVEIYPGMGHTIIQDEIDRANSFVLRVT